MLSEFRLDRYLERIGVSGPVAPDLPTLKALHAGHTTAIPFEGLDPLLGRPVKLDLASLQEKLVESRRGGYCFEQNILFKAALEAIGFNVTGLCGRVRWMSPPGSPLGTRTHMTLKVDLPESAFVADVGFGVCVMDAPLKFELETEQRTSLGTYRLSESNGLFLLSAKQPSGWRPMYVFNLEPQIHSDYELGNWFTSTSPLVLFTKMMIMERLCGDKRYKIAGRRFSVEARDGELISERIIERAEDLIRVLDQIFNVVPPASPEELFSRAGSLSSQPVS